MFDLKRYAPELRAGTAVALTSAMTLAITLAIPLDTASGHVGASDPAVSQAVASTSGQRSRMAWPSGVFVPGDDPRAHEEFGTWRGAAPDIALTFTGRAGWPDVASPQWLLGPWSAAPQTLVMSTAMLPEDGAATLTACARGAYDAHWRRFGRSIAGAGLAGRTIIRLGWEFNGPWMPWAAHRPGTFVACWRKVVTAVESAAPRVRWDWCVNRGTSQFGLDPRRAYPGDAFVDIVGVDSFDGYPAVTSERTWQAQYAGAFGLRFWADFARAHGKRFSVPEWGVYPGTSWAGYGGGDNAYYVRKMFGFFRQQADILAYEAYFNEADPYQGGALYLNPRAAAEYRRQIAASRRPS